jgi:hypothetical protein
MHSLFIADYELGVAGSGTGANIFRGQGVRCRRVKGAAYAVVP